MNSWDSDVSGKETFCKKITWTVQRDSQVMGGRAGLSSTLFSCQFECVANTGCTGFDWHPTQPQSVKCWLHGSWSAQNQLKTNQGVDHYDITRNTKCNGRLH